MSLWLGQLGNHASHMTISLIEEVHLRPSDERADKTGIYHILRSAFGEGLTSTQAFRKFFERGQRERESIQEYSHALMLLLACVERLDPEGVPDKDRLLRDQFLENLRDPQLRRDKALGKGSPHKDFPTVRDEVQHWVDDESTPERRAVVRKATTVHPLMR